MSNRPDAQATLSVLRDYVTQGNDGGLDDSSPIPVHLGVIAQALALLEQETGPPPATNLPWSNRTQPAPAPLADALLFDLAANYLHTQTNDPSLIARLMAAHDQTWTRLGSELSVQRVFVEGLGQYASGLHITNQLADQHEALQQWANTGTFCDPDPETGSIVVTSKLDVHPSKRWVATTGDWLVLLDHQSTPMVLTPDDINPIAPQPDAHSSPTPSFPATDLDPASESEERDR